MLSSMQAGKEGGRNAGREGVWVLSSMQAGRQGGSIGAVILAGRQGKREGGRQRRRQGGREGVFALSSLQAGRERGKEGGREYGCCHPCRQAGREGE